jgi:hypothetical protein
MSVRACFYSQGQKIGEVTLTPSGKAVASDRKLGALLDGHVVVAEGNPGTNLQPKDGERYLRALPTAFNGAYFYAVIEEI